MSDLYDQDRPAFGRWTERDTMKARHAAGDWGDQPDRRCPACDTMHGADWGCPRPHPRVTAADVRYTCYGAVMALGAAVVGWWIACACAHVAWWAAKTLWGWAA